MIYHWLIFKNSIMKIHSNGIELLFICPWIFFYEFLHSFLNIDVRIVYMKIYFAFRDRVCIIIFFQIFCIRFFWICVTMLITNRVFIEFLNKYTRLVLLLRDKSDFSEFCAFRYADSSPSTFELFRLVCLLLHPQVMNLFRLIPILKGLSTIK